MRNRMKSRPVKVAGVLCMVLALTAVTVLAASCGSTATRKQSTSTSKLPPGVDESQTSQAQETTAQATTPTATATTPASSGAATTTAAAASTPGRAADLYGGHFVIVNATRPDTNKSAISSSQREVKGDYLEVEFTVQNSATDHLVDLSEYSFRLQSPGIAAGTYADYYGTVGTYGAYVNENEISAALLSYSDLSPVAYKVKVGELVDKVFCFFDLNPENVGRNPGVTKDNTSVIIHKVSGTDYGNEVSIPLAGYSD